MLRRGQTTEQRIAQIADGFRQGLEGYSAGQRRQTDALNEMARQDQIERNTQAEAARRQEAYKREDERNKKEDERADKEFALREKEYNLKAKELGLPFEQTREYAKAKTIAGLKAETATPKQNEFAAAGYATRARQAVADIDKLPKDIGTGWTDTFNGMIPKVMKGENTKLFEQAKRNFITANLRKESGATIGDDEYLIEEAKYFPEPGDTKAVISQKSKSREQAIKNLEAEGGNAMSRVSPVSQSLSTTQAAPKINPQHVQAIKQMSDEELMKFVNGR